MRSDHFYLNNLQLSMWLHFLEDYHRTPPNSLYLVLKEGRREEKRRGRDKISYEMSYNNIRYAYNNVISDMWQT